VPGLRRGVNSACGQDRHAAKCQLPCYPDPYPGVPLAFQVGSIRAPLTLGYGQGEGVSYLAELDPDNSLEPLQAASCTYPIALWPRASLKG